MNWFYKCITIKIFLTISLFSAADEKILKEIEKNFIQEDSDIENYIEKSPLEDGYFFISNGESYLYIRNQNLFIKTEEILDFKNKTIHRSNILYTRNKDLLEKYIEENEIITIKKEGNKNEVYMFFDKTCVYCNIVYNKIDNYLNAGININLIPYPRNGIEGTPYQETLKFWCKNTKENCNLSVRRGYNLGEKLNITGTPAFIDRNTGKVLYGFRTPKTLIELYNYK